MPNFSSLARLEVPEKFLWVGGWGGVCKVIFVVNPTVVLRLGWGFDNFTTSLELRQSKYFALEKHLEDRKGILKKKLH